MLPRSSQTWISLYKKYPPPVFRVSVLQHWYIWTLSHGNWFSYIKGTYAIYEVYMKFIMVDLYEVYMGVVWDLYGGFIWSLYEIYMVDLYEVYVKFIWWIYVRFMRFIWLIYMKFMWNLYGGFMWDLYGGFIWALYEVDLYNYGFIWVTWWIWNLLRMPFWVQFYCILAEVFFYQQKQFFL